MTEHLRSLRLAPDGLPTFMARREAAPAWNALLRPCHPARIALAGKPFDICMIPSPAAARVWTISLDLAGTSLWLDVVPEDLWQLLCRLFPRLEGDRPEAGLAQLLLSLLVEPGLAALGLRVGQDVTLSLNDGPTLPDVPCWDQGFALRSEAAQLSLRVRAAKHPNALGFAQRLMQALFPPARAKTLSPRALHIRVPVCISLGHLNVSQTELTQIEGGGAVVPYGLHLGQQTGVVLVGRRPLAAVVLTGNRATVTEMESEMTEQMMKGVGPDGVLEDLPIKLTFEVGHQTVELGQLCETANGTVFLMDDAVRDCPVTIKANGLPYAIGHLATVGASLAVQVDRLIDDDV
ncbi:FliM/FliN family flagellar motor switch protein [uncultured Tateyamaria sp.]|uniref:FliM/FliN family flagellar motor switch protein n=1 Tax=uncultured Tateyamaria sp. TaxID=455651 RepID=UPI00262D358B|nr:FliM/FliN family flagellar motor switch protein [uncultured Tateyamaria sp.]